MVLIAPFLTLAAAAGFVLAWILCLRRGISVAAERDRALAAEAAADRAARVWASDLRAATMTLQGQAEQCTALRLDAEAHAGFIAALGHIAGLTDDLQDQMAPPTAPAVLHLAEVALLPALHDAIAAVASSLAPGQRRWRVAPGLAGHAVWADRRALSQVLQRVLGNAARHSRAGDWIEISLDSEKDGLALAVEDEGCGLCAPDRPAPPGQPESRGLGLGLALARRLMQAHGGTLTLHGAARVGTRIVLWFPADHVVTDPVAAPAAAQFRQPADAPAD